MLTVLITSSAVGALLTGSGSCQVAAKYWNRYAPTSQYNGQFQCVSSTGDEAIDILAAAVGISKPYSCEDVDALVRAFDSTAPTNTCNSSKPCAHNLLCVNATGACGYCAPRNDSALQVPCFSGGTIECSTLKHNAVAAGIGIAVAGVAALWRLNTP